MRQKFDSSSEKVVSTEPTPEEKATSDIEVVEETEDEKIKPLRKKRGNKKTPPESLPHIRV